MCQERQKALGASLAPHSGCLSARTTGDADCPGWETVSRTSSISVLATKLGTLVGELYAHSQSLFLRKREVWMKRPAEFESDTVCKARFNGAASDVDMPTVIDVALDAPEDADYAETPQGSDGAALTLYLRELRGVPVLAQAQEIELAKAREEGESLALNHLLSSRLALDHVLRLGEKVLVGELPIHAVVEGSDDQTSEDYCEDQAEDDSVRDEFLRKLKRLNRMAADLAALSAKASSASPGKKGHIKEKSRRAQDKITQALKSLRLCRAQTERITAHLKRPTPRSLHAKAGSLPMRASGSPGSRRTWG